MAFSSSKVEAPQITGSLFGTASWAVSASWAPSAGASDGVAYQTAQSGTLFDVTISQPGSGPAPTRSIGGALQSGDVNIYKQISFGATQSYNLVYLETTTGSLPISSGGTGLPQSRFNGGNFVQVLTGDLPMFSTFLAPALSSSIENTGFGGLYNAPISGALYYDATRRQYRVYKGLNQGGWQDLVSTGTSQGVAYQTAQSGTLFDVSIGTNFPSTRSIGGALQPGDLNVMIENRNYGGVMISRSLHWIYKRCSTGSVPIANGGTGLPISSIDGNTWTFLVTAEDPVFSAYIAPAASSSVEGTPGSPYFSGSVKSGSIYYDVATQKHRVFKGLNQGGWQDLVSTGTSQGVAYQTAQSGALFDVSFNSGSTNWTTRSIGGAFQPGDINVLNGFQPVSGGGLAPNTLLRYYKLFNTASSDNVQQGGTGQINNYSNTDRGFAILVDYAHPTINTFKGAATSSVETALFNANPNMPGNYNSASLVAATGSIYYATDLQRYRILKNKALGWEDLVPTGSSGGGGNLQSVTTAGNQTSASINITGSLTNGNQVLAIGLNSHAEGNQTTAIGSYSHAQGQQTTARGGYSHAEGEFTTAFAGWSHAEGRYTVSEGSWSHTEGYLTTTKGTYSHAEGFGTVSSGSHQHVQGQWNIISPDQGAFIIGNGIADLNRSNLVFASGSEFQITGSLEVSGAILLNGSPIGGGSAGNLQSVTTAGSSTTSSVSILNNFVQGESGIASNFSHAQGRYVTASGFYSHAEGNAATALGNFSHAECAGTAIGQGSHAEGAGLADGQYSHAEGDFSTALGTFSHAEGRYTTAKGIAAHTSGHYSISNANYQRVVGQFNQENATVAAFIVGNGASTGSRSNLLFAAGTSVQVTGSLLIQSSSVNGEAISNIGDTFTSTAKVTKMVTCTSAEYAAIGTKDPNTFYIVI